MKFYLVYKNHGLYDLKIDDTEPLYEEIDQPDFDQQSQPTEVPDYLDLTLTLPEFTDLRPLPDLLDLDRLAVDKDRSLTTSPFVLSTKPYRPFSTEPIEEIPPVEDPIILNPTYKDPFDLKPLVKDEELLPATRFKLPISEQYDPDGTKGYKVQKDKTEMTVTESKETTKDVKEKTVAFTEVKDVKKSVKEETLVNGEPTVAFKEVKDVKKSVKEEMAKEELMTREEVRFLEKMKTEIDLDKIEMTATSIVDESIEKAMTVAEVIKQEIDVELRESSVEISESVKETARSKTEIQSKSEVESYESKVKTTSEAAKDKSIESKVERKKVTELGVIDQATKEIIQNGYTVEENLATIKSSEATIQESVKERKVSKKEIEENVVSDKIKSKSSVSEQESVKSQQQHTRVDKNSSESTDKRDTKENITRTDTKTTKGKTTDTKYSTAKLLAEQRAFTIGLQTIPSLRGTAHSSYHYDLLLKTFFIHLTDVMVALSRFILAEPVLSKPLEKEVKTTEKEIVREEVTKQQASTVVETRKESEAAKVEQKEKITHAVAKVEQNEKVSQAVAIVEQKERSEKRVQTVEDSIVTQKKEKIQERTLEAGYRQVEEDDSVRIRELIEKRQLSGSRMAQLVEKRPEEFMQKMEAVITEFESKAVGEDVEVVRERRSRSRSRIEEPLELHGEDRRIKEVSEFTSTTAMDSSYSTSMINKRSESRYESTDQTYQSKEGKNTYLAIVEAHIYTNKDAIFDEKHEFSEAFSVRSEEGVLATEVIQAAAEKIAFENVEVSQTNDATQMAEVIDKKEEKVVEPKAVEVIEEKNEMKTDIKLTEKEDKVIIQEVVEPIIETQEVVSVSDYQVTEVKDEIALTEAKVSAIVEDTSVHEAFSIKEEAISVVEDKTSLKEDILIQEKYLAESISEQKSVKEEVAIIKEEKKEESVSVAKTEQHVAVTEIADTKVIEVSELVKQESISIIDEGKQKKESILIKEDVVSLKEEIKQDMIALKEKTFERQAIETAIVEQKLSSDVTSIKEEVTTAVKKEEVKQVTVKTERDESAQLKISKEEIVEQSKTIVQLDEDIDISIKNVEISESKFNFESSIIDQQSTFIAKSVETSEVSTKDQKLSLRTDLAKSISDETNLDTPSPTLVPPTPLTDEYVFKLEIPLAKREGPPIPRDCTPSDDDEDPHIVKKGLVPHAESEIVEQKVFNPPLRTPPTPRSPTSPKSPTSLKSPTSPRSPNFPVYTKPGLRGGADRAYSKEEIQEIERKSSLLASAIDQTIKSIEEYKVEVGIENGHSEHNSTNEIVYNGYSKVIETKVFDATVEENHTTEPIIEEEIENSKEIAASKQSIESTVEITEIDVKTTNGHGDQTETVTDNIDVVTKVTEEDKGSAVAENVEIKVRFFDEDKTSSFTENIDININITEEGKTSTVSEHIDLVKKTVDENEMTKIPENIIENRKIEEQDLLPKCETIDIPTKAIEDTLPKQEMKEIFEEKRDPMEGYRPVHFDPEDLLNAQRERRALGVRVPQITASQERELYKTEKGELMGGRQGFVDGLEEAVVDTDIAKDMGKPGMTDDKIAELISGEAEMLREAHVMGLTRVLASHMTRPDDSSVDFNKIKPIVESLKDSEVLKALNEEFMKTQAEKKKDERKWTTFLQKPKRPVPRRGGGVEEEEERPWRNTQLQVTRPRDELESFCKARNRAGRKARISLGPDYSSMDFNKIKPIVESLKDVDERRMKRGRAKISLCPDDSIVKPIVESLKASEVLKALNEEFMKTQAEKKKNERKWTTFLQKPKRPVPRRGGGVEEEEERPELYKVKIVKQPKPKVAPDYKPKDFNTGLLPWEERALREPTPPPVPPEDPILIPEEPPEILEAVDPLPESEVPDLEDSGIELPPPPEPREATPPPEEEEEDLEAVVEETDAIIEESVIEEAVLEEMDRGNVAEQLMASVQNMVDPNAPLDQQLAQMRAQLAALAQLPGVIQQSLEMVTRQLSQLSQDAAQAQPSVEEPPMEVETTAEGTQTTGDNEVNQNGVTFEEMEPTANQAANHHTIVEEPEDPAQTQAPTISQEEMQRMMKEEQDMLEEQRRIEKQKKELMAEARLESESRQIKQRPTPRVGKPKPVFGPATPHERPIVLHGGRKWRKPQDAYDETIFAETLQAQAEIIAGKAKGFAYESVLLPYDERINFMKYEKPPVSLDHLKDSDVYKMIHNVEQAPGKRVEMLTPVVAEADYREKCRSMTPCPQRLAQQVQP